MKKLLKILISSSLILPALVFAQEFMGTSRLISSIGRLVRSLILVVAGIALLVFFWGLVKFIFRIGGDEKALDEGKNLMKWGLTALFVMVSVWGIIRFFQGELLPGGNFAPPPQIPGSNLQSA